jgi:hypothetical protein
MKKIMGGLAALAVASGIAVAAPAHADPTLEMPSWMGGPDCREIRRRGRVSGMRTRTKVALAAPVIAGLVGGVGIGAIAPAHADFDPYAFDMCPQIYNTQAEIDECQDKNFRMLLEDDGILFNFKLEKSEAKTVCGRLAAGMSGLHATYMLMDEGGYPWDVANSLASAGEVAYCYRGPGGYS